MNKSAIKNFAVRARNKLIADITLKAETFGVSAEEIIEKEENSTGQVSFFQLKNGTLVELTGETLRQREVLVRYIKEKAKTSDLATAFDLVVEEIAYTWFNRLIALRFMEVNDYLPSGIRILSSRTEGKFEPDMVTSPFETDLTFTSEEVETINDMLDDGKQDDLFRMLFIRQCNKLHEILPKLFEQTNNYTELLLNISFINDDGVVYHLVRDIPEEDFKNEVEIVGWLYQYYNTEPKDKVFADLKKNIKISKENIPAATQLFTPDWIVKYMVENSLGRLWLEQNPDSDLQGKWKYYLEEAEQTPEVTAKLVELRENHPVNLEEIKFLDPCMGSGHILVYAFEVLMEIYQNQGYSERDAAQNIVKLNLHGLDIDPRAYQLAYFAVMMKGRKYDRRFFARNVSPMVYCPLNHKDLQNFGSLYRVIKLDEEPEMEKERSLFDLPYEDELQNWSFMYLLHQKYDVVCTNPPYMGGSNGNAKLVEYMKTNYPDSRSDLFAVFMERSLFLTKQIGFIAMITQHSFMFLSSYEKLRSKLLQKDFINMAHLGARAFEDIGGEVVQTTAFVIRNSKIKEYLSTFARLVDFPSQDEKEKEFLTKNHLHTAQQENFTKIPGSPIAYWVSERVLEIFKNDLLKDVAKPRKGLDSADNDRFLRFWFEIENNKANYTCSSREAALSSEKKWFPLNSGGNFRKWYGNFEKVINWEQDGYELNSYKKSYLRAKEYYFKTGISWTKISSSKLGVRYAPMGLIFDSAGQSLFPKKKDIPYILGILCSNISFDLLQALNPTLNYQVGDFERIPIIISETHKPTIDTLVEENISLSKTDWDSFETSWDFEGHPLV